MDFASHLKSSIDIVRVIGEYVRLQKAGPNTYKGLCPFHQEKTPSFHVRPSHQWFHCFGCGKKGSSIDFVMEIEALSFWEACVQLAERYGIPLYAARIWDHLEQSGISDIQGVWCHCHTLMVVVALKQRYAGHAMHALTAIAGMQTGASMYRYYVAVDDDIDPVDLKQVIWAMCTRVDPADPKVFRGLADQLRDKLKSGVVAIGGEKDGKALVLVAATKDLVARGLKAGDLVREMATEMGGSGGEISG